MKNKHLLYKNITLILFFFLLNTSVFGQLQFLISTDKNNYSYGERIIIRFTIRNITDSTVIIMAPNTSTCQAEFSLNDFNSWEHTVCLPTVEKIKIKPGQSRIYEWKLDPKKYGLPNKEGEQKIVGYFLGEKKDSITFTAEKYFGGEVSVAYFDSLETEINLLKDTLNVQVLNRSDLDTTQINETWRINGFSIDSLITKYSNDKRFIYIERSLNVQYDTIYTEFPLDYFPLHVGDIWKYFVIHEDRHGHKDSSFVSVNVIGTELLNNRKFFKVKYSGSDEVKLYSLDTANAIVYTYNSMLDSVCVDNIFLPQHERNIIFSCDFEHIFLKDTIVTIFDEPRRMKRIESRLAVTCLSTFTTTDYAYGIGNIFSVTEHPSMTNPSEFVISKLYYAKINGISYGDSVFVGVKKRSENISNKYFLSQNYPNPFNPTTTIQYKIPLSSGVRGVLKKERRETTNSLSAFGVRTTVQLKVYNVIGKEVATLVNKQQNPGNYKVTFDATNLASGVYYYQLKSGSFVETKKMILLK